VQAVAFIARRRWTNSCAPNPTNVGRLAAPPCWSSPMDDRETRFVELVDRVLLHLKNGIPPDQKNLDELRDLLSELKKEHALADAEKLKRGK
jgi:hypothetical protein